MPGPRGAEARGHRRARLGLGAHRGGGAAGRVLIVHPRPEACGALRALLEAAGHRAVCVAGGPEARERYRADKPDLVLINEELPGEASSRVFAAVKGLDPLARVLAVSLRLDGRRPDAARAFGVPALEPKDAARAVERLLARADSVPLAAARVLVVDDDPAVRETLRRFLTDRSYDVAVASSGLEALPLIGSHRPSLVLLDVQMPDLDGAETLERIRELDRDVAVMMITGDDTLEMMERCRDQGAYDYLLKPFDLEYLDFSVYSKLLLAER